MAMPIHTIHVNSATKTSLNDRFTALSTQPKASVLSILPAISRRRSRSRDFRQNNRNEKASSNVSVANRRLLQQLAKKHKIMAALKLKRRSLKPGPSMAHRRAANGMKLKRGSVKALRLSPSGSPIKANSLTNVATMKADLMSRMTTRRTNSNANLTGRLGASRIGRSAGGGVGVGGAAGRVAKRRLGRIDAARPQRPASVNRRRSRSRSRARIPAGSTTNAPNMRNNNFGQNPQRIASRGRSRSRSRSRLAGRIPPPNKININNKKVPISARLGVKPGIATNQGRSSQNAGRGRQRGNLNRIAQGRIQKPNRKNASNRAVTASVSGRGGGNMKRRLIGGGTDNKNVSEQINNNNNRPRGRSNSVARGNGRRSRSKSRNNQRIASIQKISKQQQQQVSQRGRGGRPRGRSLQRGRRGGAAATGTQRNGNGQQERRGRSRSRGRGRQLGKSSNKNVKREDLDKELDQYMATTKTETGMDFLLRN